MKVVSILALTVVAAGITDVATVSEAGAFMRTIDAPPEALIIGSSLLLVATLLRHRYQDRAGNR